MKVYNIENGKLREVENPYKPEDYKMESGKNIMARINDKMKQHFENKAANKDVKNKEQTADEDKWKKYYSQGNENKDNQENKKNKNDVQEPVEGKKEMTPHEKFVESLNPKYYGTDGIGEKKATKKPDSGNDSGDPEPMERDRYDTFHQQFQKNRDDDLER